MKHILILILTAAFALPIAAQGYKYNIGIEGGPGLIHLRGDGLGLNPGIGFSGGATFQYNFPKVMALRTGLGFERKGAQSYDITICDDAGNALGITQLRLNYDYITLPLLLRANFGKKVTLFVNAGVYFGCLIQERSVAIESFGRPNIASANNASAYQRFDTGLSSGLGLVVPVKSRLLLTLEARNSTGLYNINKVVDRAVKTSATSLLIGVAYRLGPRN